MTARATAATRMAFREQLRRPLLLILLVLVPVYVVTRSIAETEPTLRMLTLPGGSWSSHWRGRSALARPSICCGALSAPVADQTR